MKSFKVIGIGEILWDLLPEGKSLGGAPANFIFHAQQHGAQGIVISAIGNDELGNEIKKELNKKNIESRLSLSNMPTGTVTVKLNNGSPSYTINENVAWDNITLSPSAKASLENTDAVCFGSLAQRCKTSRQAIRNALEIVPEHCLKIFDINIRQTFYSKETIEKSLKYANILKINDEELELLIEIFQQKKSENDICQNLIEKYNLKLLALTKGSKESVLYTPKEQSRIKSPKVTVVDTVGAGDSFTATMIMGLLHKKPLKQLHEKAVKTSAFVCTQKGAVPPHIAV